MSSECSNIFSKPLDYSKFCKLKLEGKEKVINMKKIN